MAKLTDEIVKRLKEQGKDLNAFNVHRETDDEFDTEIRDALSLNMFLKGTVFNAPLYY